MGHSGYFSAAHLGPEWADYRTLSHVCELARMTNRQAEVTLLYLKGKSKREIQRILDIPNCEYWRSYHRATSKLVERFPRLRQIQAQVEAARDEEAHVALRSGRNGCRGTRTPLLAEDTSYGEARVYVAAGHPALVTPRDLGLLQVTILDVLAVLLEELENGRCGAKR